MEVMCVGTPVSVCAHFRIHCMTVFAVTEFPLCVILRVIEGESPTLRERKYEEENYRRKAVTTPFNFYSLFSGIVVWRLHESSCCFLCLKRNQFGINY